MTMLLIGAATVFRIGECSSNGLRVQKRRGPLLVVLVAAFCLFPTLSWVATGQWLGQVAFLTAFVVLVVTDPDLHESFAQWVIWALVPVASLALFQAVTQVVFASKWLGIASQYPLDRGVSVVESAGVRFLRSYGSFPHPNVMGGWMVLGTLMAVREALRAVRWRAALGPVCLFSAALYATFSRSAWIAFVVGWGALFLFARGGSRVRLRAVCFGAACLAVFCVGMFLRPELIHTRVVAQDRLEARSINERREGIRQALSVVLPAYPWGTGPGAYRVGLDLACAAVTCPVPAEPPHAVPFLVLAELGFLRSFVMGTAFVVVAWRARRKLDGAAVLCFGGVALVLMALDHYPWSLWSGQALLAVGILLSLQPRTMTMRVLEAVPETAA